MEYGCKYDIAGFTSDLGLPLEDIAGLYSELVTEIRSDINRLENLLREKDWDAVKAIIHNIKGISVNYRINDVYEKASLINHYLKETLEKASLANPNLKADFKADLKTAFEVDITAELEDFFAISETACQEITRYFAQKGLPF